MKIINSYLSKNIFYSTISIIGILSLIILVTQALKYVDLMISHGINGLDFMYVTVLLLPSLLFIIIPICLFIAVIYSLNKLNSYRELNVLKGIGINNFSISKPILKIAIAITLFHYFISLYWMPVVNHQFKELTKYLKENYVTFFLQERVFSHPTDYLTFYIRNKIDNNKFEDIFYHDNRGGTPTTIIAEKGELINKDNNMYFNLINGNRQEINNKGELAVLYFDTLLVLIDFDKHLSDSIRNSSIQERSLYELLFPNEDIEDYEKSRMLSEASHRIIWPFYNIILTMMAIAALLYGGYNRGGKNKRIMLFSLVSGVIVVINNSLIKVSAIYSGTIALSYIFTFSIFGILSYLLYYRKK